MWSVTQAWLDALGKSHGRYTRMEAWFGGAKVADIVPESGSVQVTARNRIRRTLTAVVPEAYWPTSSSDPLDPSGAQLKVFQGITGPDGKLVGSEVPIFGGRVEKVQRQRLSGKLTVTGLDPFAQINDQQFEEPRTISAGFPVVQAIRSLIAEVVDAKFVELTYGSTLPIDYMADADRGQAIDYLAAAIGAEVFFLPDGVTCVIRPVPVLGAASVWSLTEGVNSTIVRDAQTRSRTDVANMMVVHVEQPGQTPILVKVADTSASPTRFGGPYGKVIRHYQNALIGSESQAAVAGSARLARFIGITRSRDVDMVPNPALEAGDLFTITTAEGTEQHVADNFAVPFAPTDVMTVTTRSTATSIS